MKSTTVGNEWYEIRGGKVTLIGPAPQGYDGLVREAIEKAAAAGGFREDRCYRLEVAHDDDCAIWEGGLCGCSPTVGSVEPLVDFENN